MLPRNHKRTTCSLAPPIFYATKNLATKRWKVPHLLIFKNDSLSNSVICIAILKSSCKVCIQLSQNNWPLPYKRRDVVHECCEFRSICKKSQNVRAYVQLFHNRVTTTTTTNSSNNNNNFSQSCIKEKPFFTLQTVSIWIWSSKLEK